LLNNKKEERKMAAKSKSIVVASKPKEFDVFKEAMDKGIIPSNIEQVKKLSFIGQTAAAFYQSLINGMKEIEVAEEQRKATLADGQRAAEFLLDLEVKIGEIALATPPGIHTKMALRDDPAGEPDHQRIIRSTKNLA
jgi:hypothetical protein